MTSSSAVRTSGAGSTRQPLHEGPSTEPDTHTGLTRASDLGDDPVQRLPRYARRMLAFHRAHMAELDQMISHLPIAPNANVLDVACGDGTYCVLMAKRGARVRGLDLNEAYLDVASKRMRAEGLPFRATQGDACSLPYPDDHFDGAFCAQSFYSLPNVPAALQEMRRVVRPGGFVAVLENDSLHHVVLPWPPGLELKLRMAEHQALREHDDDLDNYYIGRCLGSELERVGLRDVWADSFATHRQAPLEADERTFLAGYLDDLMRRVHNKLNVRARRAVNRLASPDSPDYMLDAPDFNVTYIDMLAWGLVPDRNRK